MNTHIKTAQSAPLSFLIKVVLLCLLSLSSTLSVADTPRSSPVSIITGAKTASAEGRRAASKKTVSPVNINQASAETLAQQLTGIGPAKAQAIVDYRAQKGPFNKPEQLLQVKGIGPATLAKNLDRIQL